MKCYFDGSHAELSRDGSWLTLAGFMAGDQFWAQFNSGWTTEVLQRREPHAPYLHMRELYSSNGDYAGFTRERWNRLVTDAVDFLQQQPKRAFCAIVSSIDEAARQSLIAEGCAISAPQLICAEWSVGKSFSWYYDTWPDSIEPAYVYFDQGEDFMHDFRQRWLRERKTQKPVIRNVFWGLIVDVDSRDMRNTPALQAADLLAWSESRRRSSRKDRPFRYLANIIQGLVPSWRLVLDERTLRQKHAPQ